jgi:hypothetical protein
LLCIPSSAYIIDLSAFFIITYIAIATNSHVMAPGVSSTSMKQEADNHLRHIRKEKGIDSSDGEYDVNAKDLNRVLGM